MKSYYWYCVDPTWDKGSWEVEVANKVTKLHIEELCYSLTCLLPTTAKSYWTKKDLD
jgi:hypothetical protein